MDFLKSHVFTSFLISCVYFIIKNILNRTINDEEQKEWTRKTIMKDSVLLFVLVYLILIFKDQIFFIQAPKTPVFTNEPSF